MDGVGQDRVQQLDPAGEAPVQGADADSGPAGDLLQRRLQAVVAEHLPGRREDGVAVALGVAAQRPGRSGEIARAFCVGHGVRLQGIRRAASGLWWVLNRIEGRDGYEHRG